MRNPVRKLAAAMMLLCGISQAEAAEPIAPYKDRLFAYPALLSQEAGGAFRRYDYRESRDIDQRDRIPERRAERAYVDLSVDRQQRARVIGATEFYEVGAAAGARFVVIFVHGRGGDRRLGVDDWSFGGNFNRLKNLVARNGGTYWVPSVPDFESAGRAAIAGLIKAAAAASPGAPIILACASMGSILCWNASIDEDVAPYLDGLVILGGTPGTAFPGSTAMELSVPLFLAHGSSDSVYQWQEHRAAFDRLLAQAPGYPVRFALFETGSHGTPIRMIDWRDTLNWILDPQM